jgi:hypothetical protein
MPTNMTINFSEAGGGEDSAGLAELLAEIAHLRAQLGAARASVPQMTPHASCQLQRRGGLRR